jgi:hypothetical protein
VWTTARHKRSGKKKEAKNTQLIRPDPLTLSLLSTGLADMIRNPCVAASKVRFLMEGDKNASTGDLIVPSQVRPGNGCLTWRGRFFFS